MIKIGAIAGLVLTSTLLLAACSSTPESKPTHTPSSSSTPTSSATQTETSAPVEIPIITPDYPVYTGQQKSPQDFLTAIQQAAPKSKWALTSSKADSNQAGTAGFIEQVDSKDGCSIWLYDSKQHAFDARSQSMLTNFQNYTGMYFQLGVDVVLNDNKIDCAKILNKTVLFINREVTNHPEAKDWVASKANIHDCLVRGIACIDGVTTVINNTSDFYAAHMKPLYALVDAGYCQPFDNGTTWDGGGIMNCTTIFEGGRLIEGAMTLNASSESFVLDVVADTHDKAATSHWGHCLIYGDGFVMYWIQYEPSDPLLVKMNEAVKGVLVAEF